LIIGISNGGMFLADTIARILYSDVPLVCLWANRTEKNNAYFQNKCNENLKQLTKEKYNVLLTDDSIVKADTYLKARKFLTDNQEAKMQIAFLPLFTRYNTTTYLSKIVEDTIWQREEIIGKNKLSTEDVYAFLKTDYSHFPYEKFIRPSTK